MAECLGISGADEPIGGTWGLAAWVTSNSEPTLDELTEHLMRNVARVCSAYIALIGSLLPRDCTPGSLALDALDSPQRSTSDA